MTARYNPNRRNGIPLFLKLWFAFVALCALLILGGLMYFVATTSLADVGRALGALVRAFDEAAR